MALLLTYEILFIGDGESEIKKLKVFVFLSQE